MPVLINVNTWPWSTLVYWPQCLLDSRFIPIISAAFWKMHNTRNLEVEWSLETCRDLWWFMTERISRTIQRFLMPSSCVLMKTLIVGLLHLHMLYFSPTTWDKNIQVDNIKELPSKPLSQKFPQHRSISTEWAKAACSELVEHRMWASIVHHQKWTKALTLMVIFGAVRSGTKGYVLGISMIQGISWFKWNLKLQHIAKYVTDIR